MIRRSALLMLVLAWLGAPAMAQTARIEIHAIPTTTLTDEQFLNGVREGKPATIAGELRLPRPGPGAERVPAVVILHGSGGASPANERWAEEFTGMGMAAFLVDSFSGRGIVQTSSDQALLGRLAMIVDAYRALDLLAKHSRIDPQRIALIGFSRGGQSVLYGSVKRFQKMHGSPGLEFAAYIPFYAACNTTFRDDANTADRPVRIFHGQADDYVPVAPCRPYVERLRKAGKDVVLTEYPNAHHAFDNPANPQPVKAPRSQSTKSCVLHEDAKGRVINTKTGEVFTYKDPCVEIGPTVGYNAEAHAASVKAVKAFLAATFRLPQL